MGLKEETPMPKETDNKQKKTSEQTAKMKVMTYRIRLTCGGFDLPCSHTHTDGQDSSLRIWFKSGYRTTNIVQVTYTKFHLSSLFRFALHAQKQIDFRLADFNTYNFGIKILYEISYL